MTARETERSSDAAPVRDFSDWAILRGALAAALAAHLLVVGGLGAAFLGHGTFIEPDLIPQRLANAFQPVTLLVGMTCTCVTAIIGLIFLAVRKGDHTTYRAAARAGACTGAFLIAVAAFILGAPLLIGTIMTGGRGQAVPDASTFLSIASGWLSALLAFMAIGALSGLAGRVAAGNPLIVPQA